MNSKIQTTCFITLLSLSLYAESNVNSVKLKDENKNFTGSLEMAFETNQSEVGISFRNNFKLGYTPKENSTYSLSSGLELKGNKFNELNVQTVTGMTLAYSMDKLLSENKYELEQSCGIKSFVNFLRNTENNYHLLENIKIGCKTSKTFYEGLTPSFGIGVVLERDEDKGDKILFNSLVGIGLKYNHKFTDNLTSTVSMNQKYDVGEGEYSVSSALSLDYSVLETLTTSLSISSNVNEDWMRNSLYSFNLGYTLF